MPDVIPARAGLPGARLLAATSAITIRHFPDDASARETVQQAGLPWCDTPGRLAGTGPWLAWRSPQETVAIGLHAAPLRLVLQALAPGRHPGAAAADLSEALGAIELHGPLLDEWLAHLVDATAIPRQAGRTTRVRLADVAVLLLRIESQRLWVVAEQPLLPYVQEWLAYAHEGAFADMAAAEAQSGTVAPPVHAAPEDQEVATLAAFEPLPR